ncbi:hypothetical protein OSB94_17455 [Proteus vulgaris]|nr:hypothetical protein [Proteus vulgaris]MDS0789885.1 hypothetical protein [Proteus vulgaris]
MPAMRKAKSIRITTSGTVIKFPKLVKTATGRYEWFNGYQLTEVQIVTG